MTAFSAPLVVKAWGGPCYCPSSLISSPIRCLSTLFLCTSLISTSWVVTQELHTHSVFLEPGWATQILSWPHFLLAKICHRLLVTPCYDWIPQKDNLREKWLMLTQGFRDFSLLSLGSYFLGLWWVRIMWPHDSQEGDGEVRGRGPAGGRKRYPQQSASPVPYIFQLGQLKFLAFNKILYFGDTHQLGTKLSKSEPFGETLYISTTTKGLLFFFFG